MKVKVIEDYTREYGFERQTSLSIEIDGKHVFGINEL